MSIEEIRSYRNAEPFRPFTLSLNDGRVLHVKLPLRIALAPDGQRVAVFDGPSFDLLKIEQICVAAPEEQSQFSQG